MNSVIIGVCTIVFFLVLITTGIPIAYAMGISAFLGFSVLTSPAVALRMLATEVYSAFSSYSLTVVPMYVWMGFLAYYSGLGAKLYNLAFKLVGHVRGGLCIATEVACALFGAVCGSTTATAATIGAIALPEMHKRGYDAALSTASVAAGGNLGVLIPPSIVFMVYGIATEQSIGKLFIAGIVPGIVLTILYSIAVVIITWRNPNAGPPGPKASWRDRWVALRDGLWETIVVFGLSIGGLLAGWFTPTEAGAVGALGILAIVLLQRSITLEGFKKSLTDTTRTTAMIMLLLAFATAFGRVMAVSKIPFALADWVRTLDLPRWGILWVIVFVYLIAGCFMDALAMVVLTIPIFYPVVVNTLGYDPIWFGVLNVLALGLGNITPPVGMNVYIIKGVAKDVPLETIFRGVWWFVIAGLVCVAILVAFPGLATFLPNLMSH